MLLWPVPALLRYPGPPMEEGFMLVFPEQILNGNFPHRDFLHLYGPGSLYTLAGAFKVFGTHLTVERLFGLLQHAVLVYSMWFLIRPFGRKVATGSALTALVVLLWPAGLTALAWNGALALGFLAMACSAAASRATGERTGFKTTFKVVAGASAGLALLFRPDMILAIGLAMAAWWFQFHKGSRAPMLYGFAGMSILWIPHLMVSGFRNSLDGMFIEPVFRLRGGRSLPIPPSWGEIDAFLQKVDSLREPMVPSPFSPANQTFLWFLLVLGSAGILVWAAVVARRTKPPISATLSFFPAALFGIALVTQALQRPDSTHLAWVSGITFALCIPAFVLLLQSWRPEFPPNARSWVAVGIPALILILVIPFYPVSNYLGFVSESFGSDPSGHVVQRADRRFYLGDTGAATEAQTIVDILDEESDPGESLIVGPSDLSRTTYSDAWLYHLFPELPAGTRYIEMDPGLADSPDGELAAELARADWVILSDLLDDWSEPNDSVLSGSTAAGDVLDEQFCLVADTGRYTLYQRCAND